MHHYITGEILASLMVKWMTGIFQQLWHESIWSLFLKSEILMTLVIVFQLYCSIFSLLCFGCWGSESKLLSFQLRLWRKHLSFAVYPIVSEPVPVVCSILNAWYSYAFLVKSAS